MSTFTLIILIAFVLALCTQLIAAINRACTGLIVLFAFELAAFAYIAHALL